MTSTRTTIARGHILVTAPVIAAIALPLRYFDPLTRAGRGPLAAFLVFGGFLVAWLWWSIWAPRWRLWALKEVADRPAAGIRALAQTTGLLWRPGHFFERTELRFH